MQHVSMILLGVICWPTCASPSDVFSSLVNVHLKLLSPEAFFSSAGARVLEQGGHGQFWGAHGERVEREPLTGVWRQSLQRGPGVEPLVRGSGGEAP